MDDDPAARPEQPPRLAEGARELRRRQVLDDVQQRHEVRGGVREGDRAGVREQDLGGDALGLERPVGERDRRLRVLDPDGPGRAGLDRECEELPAARPDVHEDLARAEPRAPQRVGVGAVDGGARVGGPLRVAHAGLEVVRLVVGRGGHGGVRKGLRHRGGLYGPGMELLPLGTPHGEARVHLHAAPAARGALLLGHGAGGPVTAKDLVAVTRGCARRAT